MRHKKRFSLILALLLVSALASADTPEQLPSFRDVYSNFGIRVLNRLMEARKEADENIVFSPLSLQFSLGMLQEGASGETLREMQQSMGLGEYTVEEIGEYNRQVLDELLKDNDQYGDGSANVKMASGMFVDNDFAVEPSYMTACQNNYDAIVKKADLDDQATYEEIDRWCNEQTGGIVPKLDMKPSIARKMILLNMLVFNARWQVEFPDGMPQRNFYNGGVDMVNINFMHKTDRLYYAETDEFQMVKMNYNMDGHFSMFIFLPKDTLSTAPLTTEVWNDAHKRMERYSVVLDIPPFSAYVDADMGNACRELGMNRVFADTLAELTGISGKELLHVQEIKQMSGIKVDTRGTMAYAATHIYNDIPTGMESKWATMLVNHPFYFTIEDNRTRSILYMGRIGNITEAQRAWQGVPAPNAILDPESQPDANSTIHDLQGRRLTRIPQKGIYIRNGKKYLR